MGPAITRRGLLQASGAAATLALAGLPRGARAAVPVRVGMLPFGTVHWELDTIQRRGLDKANGITLTPVELASPTAGQVALQGGAVDVIASDWLWVARQRAAGVNLSFIPYSSAVGAIVVPADSPIKSVADLKGRRVGIAGGPLDKGWLLLQALAERDHGMALAKAATPTYAAPPLLSQQMEAGRLDALLTYWHFAAKLEAKGMRQLVGVREVARALGQTTDVPMLGYVFKEEWAKANPAAIEGFAAASRQAKAVLVAEDKAWEPLAPILGAPDPATATKLRDRFREGVPTRWGEAERADADRLFGLLAKLGGPELVGTATSIPEGTFWPVAWG